MNQETEFILYLLDDFELFRINADRATLDDPQRPRLLPAVAVRGFRVLGRSKVRVRARNAPARHVGACVDFAVLQLEIVLGAKP
jgi:hypothetical protein